MNYKIAIPSYKRPETIKKKTLKIIDEHNIDINRVTIFVADKEEEKEYINSLGSKYKIVVGVPTIGEQRNFIEKYYPENTKLVMLDDDLDGVFVKDGSKLKPINNLEKDFIVKGFDLCEKNKTKIFGMYAAGNPYFMKHRVYKKLSYIIASMFGIIVEHDEFLERKTNHGEDYEYSIRQYIKNKKLIRFDDITVKSNYYKQEGGLQEIRTKQYIFDSIHRIYNMFPNYCTPYIRKSTGNAELRLRDKRL
jgi:hypothetical protein